MAPVFKTLTRLVLAVAPVFAAALAGGATLTLSKVQEKLGLPERTGGTNLVTIADGTNSLTFRPGYRRMSLNGTAMWLNSPANADFREVMTLDGADLSRFLSPLLTGRPTAQTNRAFRVFLDPGHGGEDSGAISKVNGLVEKDLVLDVADRVGAWLEDAGLEVVFSRTNDVFVSLDERSALAKKAKADVFVSIHANITAGTTARGAETFALTLAGRESTSSDSSIGNAERPGNAFDAGSAWLGYAVHSRLPGRRGEADRGFRRARFQVLRLAPCPAVLVELGFLSNPSEVRSLSSGRFREKTAKAIADGIIEYAEKARSK